jgi:hypothetical protein
MKVARELRGDDNVDEDTGWWSVFVYCFSNFSIFHGFSKIWISYLFKFTKETLKTLIYQRLKYCLRT